MNTFIAYCGLDCEKSWRKFSAGFQWRNVKGKKLTGERLPKIMQNIGISI